MKMSLFEKLMFTWAIGGGIILLAWLLIGVLLTGTIGETFTIAVIVWIAPIVIAAFVISFRTLLEIWGVK